VTWAGLSLQFATLPFLALAEDLKVTRVEADFPGVGLSLGAEGVHARHCRATARHSDPDARHSGLNVRHYGLSVRTVRSIYQEAFPDVAHKDFNVRHSDLVSRHLKFGVSRSEPRRTSPGSP
jgi:hypothetical protein